MTDLRTLADAFEELERRGDAAEARMPDGLSRRPAARRMRLVPVGVAAAVVVGLAASVAILAPGDTPANRPAGPPPSASDPAPPSTATPPAGVQVPATPEELADRFRTVLGDTATFVVTETGSPRGMNVPSVPGSGGPPADSEPNGAAIIGTLTAAGVTGGFDLQIYQGDPNLDAECGGCTVSQLDDGSTLWTGVTALEGPDGGTTHEAALFRPDGVTTIMHVSNQRSPKGASDVLAGEPPLTVDRMVQIVTSELW